MYTVTPLGHRQFITRQLGRNIVRKLITRFTFTSRRVYIHLISNGGISFAHKVPPASGVAHARAGLALRTLSARPVHTRTLGEDHHGVVRV